ncbi:hypothetical protein GCM10020331_075330 [Ectobacillus funiculus]
MQKKHTMTMHMFKKTMAKQLIDSLPQHLVERQINILEIGCGSGYLTQLLCKAFPKARILAIDLAPGMIDVAQERIQEERVTFFYAVILRKSFLLAAMTLFFQTQPFNG